MSGTSEGVVSATRRIQAPVHEVFTHLADPDGHPRFDGTEMVRDGRGNAAISAVGDTFVMRMFNDAMGDYEMTNHVVEFVMDRRVAWEPELTGGERPEVVARIGERMGHRWGYELVADGPEATVVTEFCDYSNATGDLAVPSEEILNWWMESMATSLQRLGEQWGERSED
jgi:hypothetical protein